MDNLDSLSDDELEKELERRRDKKRQEAMDKIAREKYDNDWDLALKEDYARYGPMKIYDIALVGNKVHFRVENGSIDLHNTIRGHTYSYNALESEYSVEYKKWMIVHTILLNFPRVVISMSDKAGIEIANYRPAPDYYIEMDHRTLTVKQGPAGNGFVISKIRTANFDSRRDLWRVPYTEAWKLAQVLDDEVEYQKKQQRVINVEYSKEAEEFTQEQISKRAALDAIAMRSESDFFPTLGEYSLKHYQQQSVEFLEAAGGSAIIGHEMGLGKTPCFIAWCEHLRNKNGKVKALVICPAALKLNWERQIYKFTKRHAYVCIGSKPTDYDMAKFLTASDGYFIINYDIVAEVTKYKKEWNDDEGHKHIEEGEIRQWVELINMSTFDTVGIDEAHYIKAVESKRSQAVREVKAPSIVPLTGTPIMNYPNELWPLLSVVDKDTAGPYETFVMSHTIDKRRVRDVESLRELLKPMMFRKTKKDVLKELPPINRIIQPYELSPEGRKIYEKDEVNFWSAVDEWDGDEHSAKGMVSVNNILAAIMKMKQACAWDKVSYIADLATDLYDQSENGHKKVLIFSQFTDTPAVVAAIARRLGDEALYFTGSNDFQDRMNIVDRFQKDDRIHFLCAGTKAASEGLDITAAGHVIFTDFMWNPGTHNQAEGRAYGRLSDLHSIDSYYVTAGNTIEDWIMELMNVKLEIFNSVVEGTEASRNVSIAMELIKKLKGMRSKR